MELEEEHQAHSHHPPKAFGNCGYESHPHWFPVRVFMQGPSWGQDKRKDEQWPRRLSHGTEEFQCQDGGNN
ncbi:hypothetical protein CFAM422_000167 [Trichoderma lentiforme]|uniref:Uncharacterized protein n=1 Tax=Trichoderma lentiforme TaxID=1567552 RepID=A0A9P4XRX4_9HYPO|nr:hypothetical protein CFAM422_000167 [Trichoderma lentiforme]